MLIRYIALSKLGQNLQDQYLEGVQGLNQLLGGFLGDDSLDCISCFKRSLC